MALTLLALLASLNQSLPEALPEAIMTYIGLSSNETEVPANSPPHQPASNSNWQWGWTSNIIRKQRHYSTIRGDCGTLPLQPGIADWLTLCRVATLLLRNNSRTFSGLSRTPKKVFSRTIYTVHALLYLLYAASSTATRLTKCAVQKDAIPKSHVHYIWNEKYFKNYCHFVSVSKSPNLALCMSVNLNHNKIPGLLRTLRLISRTFQDQSHLPGLSWSSKFRKNKSRNFHDFPGGTGTLITSPRPYIYTMPQRITA